MSETCNDSGSNNNEEFNQNMSTCHSHLLESGLSPDIMAEHILRFLNRKTVLLVMTEIPAICDHFNLADYYCSRRGTKHKQDLEHILDRCDECEKFCHMDDEPYSGVCDECSKRTCGIGGCTEMTFCCECCASRCKDSEDCEVPNNCSNSFCERELCNLCKEGRMLTCEECQLPTCWDCISQYAPDRGLSLSHHLHLECLGSTNSPVGQRALGDNSFCGYCDKASVTQQVNTMGRKPLVTVEEAREATTKRVMQEFGCIFDRCDECENLDDDEQDSGLCDECSKKSSKMFEEARKKYMPKNLQKG